MSENIETLQRSTRVIPSPPEVKAQAHIQDYESRVQRIHRRPRKILGSCCQRTALVLTLE